MHFRDSSSLDKCILTKVRDPNKGGRKSHICNHADMGSGRLLGKGGCIPLEELTVMYIICDR